MPNEANPLIAAWPFFSGVGRRRKFWVLTRFIPRQTQHRFRMIFPLGETPTTSSALRPMTKPDLLDFLSAHPDADARIVAQQFRCSQEAAGMALLRINRQGLVSRTWDPNDRVLYYNLTPKGRVRREYWTKCLCNATGREGRKG